MALGKYIPAIKYGNLVDNFDINPQISQTATLLVQSTSYTTTVGETVTTSTAVGLLTLGTTPITIVTTTAPGQAIAVDSMAYEFVPGTTTYTSGGVIELVYGTTTTTGNIMANDIAIATVTSGSAGYYYTAATTTTGGAVITANAGISLGIRANANFATGNGYLRVYVNYYIITL
jgi:hypothetical protein